MKLGKLPAQIKSMIPRNVVQVLINYQFHHSSHFRRNEGYFLGGLILLSNGHCRVQLLGSTKTTYIFCTALSMPGGCREGHPQMQSVYVFFCQMPSVPEYLEYQRVSRVSKTIQEYPRVSKSILEYPGVSKRIQECPWVSKTKEYLRASWSILT